MRHILTHQRNNEDHPSPLIHCLDPQLEQAIVRACLRAWLESPL